MVYADCKGIRIALLGKYGFMIYSESLVRAAIFMEHYSSFAVGYILNSVNTNVYVEYL